MKYLTFICAITLGLAVQAPQAHAGDEGWAALGGFVAGSLVNEFTHHRHGNSYRQRGYGNSYRSECSAAPSYRPARYAPRGRHGSRGHGYAVQHVVTHTPPAPCGRWEVRKEKYWVPGQYATRNTSCGPRTEWHEGHWATRDRRVWIEDTGNASGPPYRGPYSGGHHP